MPQLIVESDADQAGPFTFSVESSDLLALLSFGYAEPFGSQHPLTEFVRHLRRDLGIDVAPLATFYDHDANDAEDAANLAAAWQEPAPLAGSAAAAHAALVDDRSNEALRTDFPNLPTLLTELTAMAAWASEHGARIRLSFTLS